MAGQLSQEKDPLEIGSHRDNAREMEDELRRELEVVKFGSRTHLTATDADLEAASLVPSVLAEGAGRQVEFGHRLVTHTRGSVSWHTYLAYAGGNRP